MTDTSDFPLPLFLVMMVNVDLRDWAIRLTPWAQCTTLMCICRSRAYVYIFTSRIIYNMLPTMQYECVLFCCMYLLFVKYWKYSVFLSLRNRLYTSVKIKSRLLYPFIQKSISTKFWILFLTIFLCMFYSVVQLCKYRVYTYNVVL